MPAAPAAPVACPGAIDDLDPPAALPPRPVPPVLSFFAEFAITVALSFLLLLVILRATEYALRLVVDWKLHMPCTAAHWQLLAEFLAALSPLAVLGVTTACAALVFVAFGCVAAARRVWTTRAHAPADAEAGASKGGSSTYAEPERKDGH
ncbi:hypothetical protein GGX14DRAFT_695749 [Mycena pura]|uniref:Uncharacterized protein n=1 Tax=Mycena pura TaxID=153505 RepID=A0AAD6YFM4_9AGAR|nr:hypothetical protein GGX14DRAFT_695749 [Mycena pura]